jgi:signal transduction histidine kinase
MSLFTVSKNSGEQSLLFNRSSAIISVLIATFIVLLFINLENYSSLNNAAGQHLERALDERLITAATLSVQLLERDLSEEHPLVLVLEANADFFDILEKFKSRALSRDPDLNLKTRDISATIRQSFTQFKNEYPGISFDLELEENICVRHDTDRIHQVLLNLFINAVDASKETKPKINLNLYKKLMRKKEARTIAATNQDLEKAVREKK